MPRAAVPPLPRHSSWHCRQSGLGATRTEARPRQYLCASGSQREPAKKCLGRAPACRRASRPRQLRSDLWGDQPQGNAGASVSPFCRRRTLTKAIQAKMTNAPARVAAPSPTVEKTAFAAKTAGTVSRLGIHESRQAGSGGTRTQGRAVPGARTPRRSRFDLVGARVPRDVVTRRIIPRQSRWKMPSKNVEMPSAISTAAPMRPMTSGLSARHKPSPSRITRMPVRFARPGCRSRGLRPSSRRSEMSSFATLYADGCADDCDPSDVERDECKEAANPADARRHA